MQGYRVEFSNVRAPAVRPEEYWPVQVLCRASGYGRERADIASLLRNVPGRRNGLPMLRVREPGTLEWCWVSRLDLFCVFLAHRRDEGLSRRFHSGDALKRAARGVVHGPKMSRVVGLLQARGDTLEWEMPRVIVGG